MSKASDLLRDFANMTEGLPEIRLAFVSPNDGTYRRLDEGKWVDGRFPGSIRLDQATHMQGAGQLHAHVYGKKGNQLVVVNFDGSGSHGSKGTLHKDDAATLSNLGFKIRADRIIEWWIVPEAEALYERFS